ncbi:MDIS1-interacting receptor like kinase 2-like protein [Tanacetum coccineum]
MSSSNFSLLSLALLLIALSIIPHFATASLKEETALLKWKASLQIPNNSQILSSWTPLPMNSSATARCPSWFGIVCNADGNIYKLNLTMSELNGTLHDFPFSILRNLTHFELSVNSFFGPIPPEIGLLSKLVYLDFSANQFSGPIPPEIGMLANLETLHLFENNFNGSIPPEIGQLTSLLDLALYNNSLQGELPTTLGNLRKLAYLYLDDNKLSGQIPPEFGQLVNLLEVMVSLESLSLFSNNLSGLIPSSLGDLTSLNLLHLYQNQLSGPIPIELGNLQFLTDLALSENKLNGSIPSSLQNLINLQYLYLRVNKLSGPIPEGLGSANLLELQMDNNQLSGQLPEDLCQGGKLQNLSLSLNQLSGSIPVGLKNCQSLTRATFDWNLFNGDISNSFGVYPSLVYLDVSHNNFHGQLSLNWSKCKKLTALGLGYNNISGSIPPEFGKTQLQRLDLTSNRLVGEIPKELGQMKDMLYLSLSDNKLSGVIPHELRSLHSLLALDLSNNTLTGPIPRYISDWAQIVYLNLSHNKLTEKIPSEIGKLSHLTKLDLSWNLLTNEIPSAFQSLVGLAIMNLSHNSLSGSIPKAFSYLPSGIDINLSYNELVGLVPPYPIFSNASIVELQGNPGLCGNFTGLELCESQSLMKKNNPNHHWVILVIMLPLFITLLLGLCVSCFMAYRRQKKTFPEEPSVEAGDDFFSISSFDGRAVHDEIVKATNDFHDAYCIGTGGYGVVYKAKLQPNNIVTVKKLHSASEKVDNAGFHNEVRALSNIRHRNIVKLYGYCFHARHSFLIYEYLAKGSLKSVLSADIIAKELDWLKRVNIVRAIANGLAYMHHNCSPPIIHRDISGANILLDADYEAHTSDFGTAKLLKLDSSNWTAIAGTYGYIAPGDSRIQPPACQLEKLVKSVLILSRACLNSNPQERPTMRQVSNILSMEERLWIDVSGNLVA